MKRDKTSDICHFLQVLISIFQLIGIKNCWFGVLLLYIVNEEIKSRKTQNVWKVGELINNMILFLLTFPSERQTFKDKYYRRLTENIAAI